MVYAPPPPPRLVNFASNYILVYFCICCCCCSVRQMDLDSSSSQPISNGDDMRFLAPDDHPKLQGQEANALGPFQRVFAKHKVVRKVSGADYHTDY